MLTSRIQNRPSGKGTQHGKANPRSLTGIPAERGFKWAILIVGKKKTGSNGASRWGKIVATGNERRRSREKGMGRLCRSEKERTGVGVSQRLVKKSG